MKLLSGPASMFGAKVEIALREKSLDFELEMVPFSFSQGYHPVHAEVRRVNPHKQQIPVLLDADVELYDSTQIFEYLEDRRHGPSLWPHRVHERVLARRLELESDEVLFPWVARRMKRPVDDAERSRSQAAKESILAHYRDLEGALDGRAYLAGEFSYADIAYFMAILFAERLGVRVPETLANLRTWQGRLATRPSFSVVGARVSGFFDTASSSR